MPSDREQCVQRSPSIRPPPALSPRGEGEIVRRFFGMSRLGVGWMVVEQSPDGQRLFPLPGPAGERVMGREIVTHSLPRGENGKRLEGWARAGARPSGRFSVKLKRALEFSSQLRHTRTMKRHKCRAPCAMESPKPIRRALPKKLGLLELIRAKREWSWKPSVAELKKGRHVPTSRCLSGHAPRGV